jgi:hypothetical protein
VECPDCKQKMMEADSCTKTTIEGVSRDSEDFDYNERCHDCNIVNKKGNFHHLGCDVERCPKCGNQLISCGCFVF